MNKFYFCGVIFLLFAFNACNEKMSEDPMVNLANERQEALTLLGVSGEKVWKVQSGFLLPTGLTNANSQNPNLKIQTSSFENAIDIGDNINVQDDEFSFSSSTLLPGTQVGENLNLKWQRRLGINTSATLPVEALSDRNASNLTFDLSFQEEASNSLISQNGSISITILEGQTLKLLIENNDGTAFEFNLVAKTSNNFAQVPANGLEFSSLFNFEFGNAAPGMVASYRTNSIYVASRYFGPAAPNISSERLVQFDLNSNQYSEYFLPVSDYVSKQMHIVNDNLYVFGGSFLNIYPLGNLANATTIPHTKQLSRFGTATLDDQIYIFGGDLGNLESDKIFKWEQNAEEFVEFATLPVPSYGARGKIVDDHLYIFGGTEEFDGPNASDLIFKISMDNPDNIESFRLPIPLSNTYVDTYQNLIYVAGWNKDRSDLPNLTHDFILGAFNTVDNTFKEIPTNLQSGVRARMYQICIFDGKLYMIFDNPENVGTSDGTWDILVSDLE